MKKTTLRKATLLFALSSFIFVSCDQNDDLVVDNTKDTPITILSAGVADLSTRAGTPAGTLTSHHSEWLRSKSLQIINAGEGVEKREPSYTVGGNAN